MTLVSSTGEIRFWENMSLALANVERYQTLELELGEGDFAERIWKVDVSFLSPPGLLGL
jgi:nuclear pore complex protein Nup133